MDVSKGKLKTLTEEDKNPNKIHTNPYVHKHVIFQHWIQNLTLLAVAAVGTIYQSPVQADVTRTLFSYLKYAFMLL